MPWAPNFYQCLPLPSQCSRQFTGYDFYGGDIKTVYGLQPGDCCATCLSTSGCLAYTFINNNSGTTACYLKADQANNYCSTMLASISITFASVMAVVYGDCTTPSFGSCGSDAAGVSCCPTNQYCQPWNADYYQCIGLPAQCTEQYPGVDFYGNDLETIYGIQPGECCTHCTETSGCVAYTFVNSNPGQTACYLKSGTGTKTNSVVTSPPTPTSTPSTCTTEPYASCGSSTGTTCCPSGYYCQPWSDSFYQCIQPPSQCSSQLTDVDYPGNDLQTVYVNLPSLCCDACSSTTGCKAYTYINNNPGQPVCYLKSAVGTASTMVGAVSGRCVGYSQLRLRRLRHGTRGFRMLTTT
ncbi:Putative CBEL-like protein [Phytophthora palmivora]|uniref:CBEL-like protein n=1 Tax=Phytophthora palmivora TaxID=4796 RepID=A0A2P4XLE8_9STRA|nr:Putative CBEL-like protein [Phytophthora palmivora]